MSSRLSARAFSRRRSIWSAGWPAGLSAGLSCAHVTPCVKPVRTAPINNRQQARRPIGGAPFGRHEAVYGDSSNQGVWRKQSAGPSGTLVLYPRSRLCVSMRSVTEGRATLPTWDVTRILLAVLALGGLIAASLWVLRPFLPAMIWATMIVRAPRPAAAGGPARSRGGPDDGGDAGHRHRPDRGGHRRGGGPRGRSRGVVEG